MDKKYYFIIVLLLLYSIPSTLYPVPLYAQESVLADPGIPDGEKITYISIIGNDRDTVVEKTESGTDTYNIVLDSGAEKRVMRIEKSTMKALYAYTSSKFSGATIDYTIAVRENSGKQGKKEIKLVDFSGIRYILRGFPFGKEKAVKVSTFAADEKGYSMSVRLIKKEKIKINHKIFNCYRLEFNMTGILSAFFPRMNYWYTVEEPHYLVRYEGAAGPMTPKRRIFEIVNYEIEKQ